MDLKSTDPRDYETASHGIVAMPKEFPSSFRVPLHVHGHAQLIYAPSGVMEVTTADGLWLLPPQRALWMPAGIAHAMAARCRVSLRTLYVAPDACPPSFPNAPRPVRVNVCWP